MLHILLCAIAEVEKKCLYTNGAAGVMILGILCCIEMEETFDVC